MSQSIPNCTKDGDLFDIIKDEFPGPQCLLNLPNFTDISSTLYSILALVTSKSNLSELVLFSESTALNQDRPCSFEKTLGFCFKP